MITFSKIYTVVNSVVNDKNIVMNRMIIYLN